MAKKPNYQQISANLDKALAPKRRPDRLDSLLSEYEDAPDVAVHNPEPVYVHTQPTAAVHIESAAVNTATISAAVAVNTATSQTAAVHTSEGVAVHIKDRHSPLQTRKNFWLSRPLAKEIKEFCASKELTETQFFQLAAVHFMQNVAVHNPASVAVNTAHDDMKIYSTNEDIIMLFEKYVGKKWKADYDRVGRQFNDLDTRLVEVVFIETITKFRAARGNAGKRIGSFNYFLDELRGIQTQAREGMLALDMIDSVLKRRRDQWAEMEGKR